MCRCRTPRIADWRGFLIAFKIPRKDRTVGHACNIARLHHLTSGLLVTRPKPWRREHFHFSFRRFDDTEGLACTLKRQAQLLKYLDYTHHAGATSYKVLFVSMSEIADYIKLSWNKFVLLV